MGTRSIAGVVVDGTIKAGYNQFDGYPEGIGVAMFANARKLAELPEPELLNVIEAWRNVELVKESDAPTPAQLELLDERGVDAERDWYWTLRDAQAGALDVNLKAGFMLDSREFGYDSLFCEYGWLIDLDQRTLECYRGFQKEPHNEGRWAGTELSNGYAGIKLAKTFTWDELIAIDDDDEFVAQLDRPMERNTADA